MKTKAMIKPETALPSEPQVRSSAWLAAIGELRNKAEEKRKSPTTAVPAEYWEGRRDGLNDAIRIVQDSMAANDCCLQGIARPRECHKKIHPRGWIMLCVWQTPTL